jgi:hypothetical protein
VNGRNYHYYHPSFFEFLFEILINIPFDFLPKNKSAPESIWPYSVISFFGACFLNWLSLFIFKHTFIPTPSLRIANLILSPIVAAFVSEALAKRRSIVNDFIVPRNHFWLAFWFTLGFTVVRFAYAIHLK